MATCPRCGEFLNDQHRCAGLWLLRLRAWSALALGGVVGGVGGWLIISAIMGEASWLAIAATAVAGIAVVSALQRS